MVNTAFDSDWTKGDPAILAAVAEDLKAPLLQIKYTAELARATGNLQALESIQQTAKSAMSEIDALLLGLRAAEGQLVLPLTPEAPSSVVYQTIQTFKPLAESSNCGLQVENHLGSAVAMMHEPTLKHVVFSLSNILMKLSVGFAQKPELSYSVSGRKKLAIIITSNAAIDSMLKAVFEQSKTLQTGRKRASGIITAGPAAGFFAADKLLQAMEAKLSLTSHKDQAGIRILLTPSSQLSLV